MEYIPASVSDVLLHEKDTDRTEKVVMPITRYKNVLNAPNIVTTANDVKGAPFVLLETDTESLSIEQIRALSGNII